jgi:hypothetical protein
MMHLSAVAGRVFFDPPKSGLSGFSDEVELVGLAVAFLMMWFAESSKPVKHLLSISK